MSKRQVLFFLVIVAIGLASFAPSKNIWVEFKPDNGRCSILMPGVPEKKQKTVNTRAGVLTMNIFVYQPGEGKDENVVYSVMYSDYPADKMHSDSVSQLKTFFDMSRDGAVNNVSGKLLSEKIIKYRGFPGRELHISYKDGLAEITSRIYLVRNRFYMTQVITLAEKKGNRSIDKFMNSFKLLDK